MKRHTNWDEYYQKKSRITYISRKITERRLIKLIEGVLDKNISVTIIELGGANSCFIRGLSRVLMSRII